MSRYETPHYARLFHHEAHTAQDAATKNKQSADFNRKTLYAVMEGLKEFPEAQEAMLQTCHEMGHNQNVINALVRRMD